MISFFLQVTFDVTEETTAFMIRGNVKEILRKEKEKASTSTICLNLKLHYHNDIAAKPYPTLQVVPQFKSLKDGEFFVNMCFVFLTSLGA